MQKEFFFSIVVPAHNEEKYIQDTLRHLQALEYPNDSYEVIVIENGSTDATYEKAKAFESDQFHIYSIPEAGVSNARNIGGSKSNPDADWVFFLDADTYPEPPFLRSLSNFLHVRANHGYVLGTTQLQPSPKNFFMSVLYWFTNISFRLSGSVYGGALLVKRPLLDVASFDKELNVGEDASLARKLKSLGELFFFSTNLMYTSTRRFQKGGWKRIPVWVGMWIFAMIVPHHAESITALQRRLKYEAVR